MTTRSRVSTVLSSAALAAIAIAGCGGSSGSGGDDPASLAPSGSPLFVEATVKPEGDLKTNIEDLSKTLAGISDPGSLIVNQIDSGLADSGSKMSFEDDVEPWLGEKAGVFFQRYDGQDFSGVGAIVETTDSAAAGDFVDKLAQESDSPVTQGSYEGSDYTTDTEDGTSVGVVGDFLVLAEDKQTFETVVDTSKGDSLADESKYDDTVSGAPDDSLADAYVDIGALINSAGGQVGPAGPRLLQVARLQPQRLDRAGQRRRRLRPGRDRRQHRRRGRHRRGRADRLHRLLPGGLLGGFRQPRRRRAGAEDRSTASIRTGSPAASRRGSSRAPWRSRG